MRRSIRLCSRTLTVALGILLFGAPYARSVTIINVDATKYGVPWAGGPTLPMTLDAGTYSATLVNPTIDTSAIYWSWSFQADWSWRTAWGLEFNDGDGLQSLSAGSVLTLPNKEDAYDAAVKAGETSTSFTLDRQSVVSFYVRDNYMGDNQGGVSLAINRSSTATVPDNCLSVWLLGCGLFSLTILRRKSTQQQ
jgi:hypothetical protein